MAYVTDEQLDRESPEDQPMILAWEMADRLKRRANEHGDAGKLFALKGVSELAYRCVSERIVYPEAMARQLESMAGYVRRHLGGHA